ncbi:MAG: MarR family transcriptional regulator [Alphaproteobacteria bacterium]|nr:MarR family transcriptional regulator [Alphaproteobacteria bacterium]
MVELSERQALAIWRRAMTESVRSEQPDLSARQMALMLTVYQDPVPQTVRGLAAHLKVSKPAIVRALDSLGKLDFVRRRPDERDRRSVQIHRTVRGAVFLSEFAGLVAQAAREP